MYSHHSCHGNPSDSTDLKFKIREINKKKKEATLKVVQKLKKVRKRHLVKTKQLLARANYVLVNSDPPVTFEDFDQTLQASVNSKQYAKISLQMDGMKYLASAVHAMREEETLRNALSARRTKVQELSGKTFENYTASLSRLAEHRVNGMLDGTEYYLTSRAITEAEEATESARWARIAEYTRLIDLRASVVQSLSGRTFENYTASLSRDAEARVRGMFDGAEYYRTSRAITEEEEATRAEQEAQRDATIMSRTGLSFAKLNELLTEETRLKLV
jgi:hypothetical protein